MARKYFHKISYELGDGFLNLSSIIKKDFYTDDLITAVDDIIEALEILRNIRKVFQMVLVCYLNYLLSNSRHLSKDFCTMVPGETFFKENINNIVNI